jgi:hypothetical protein
MQALFMEILESSIWIAVILLQHLCRVWLVFLLLLLLIALDTVQSVCLHGDIFFHNHQKLLKWVSFITIFLHYLFYCRVYALSAILKSNLIIPTSILLVGSAILSLFFSHKCYTSIPHIVKIVLCNDHSFYRRLTCKFITEFLVPENTFMK